MSIISGIGLFSEVYPPIMDGVAVAVYNYNYWLNKKGFTTTTITPYAPHCVEEDSVLRYFSVPSLFRPPYRLGVPFMDYSLHKQLQAMPLSILHTHAPFSAGRLALHTAQDKNIPLVATFHSKYRDDFARYVKNKQLLNGIIKNIVKFYEAADEVWVPQESVKEVMREYGYKGPIEVVENGTDYTPPANIQQMRHRSRIQLGIDNDELPVFLYVGQHVWEKNLQFVLNVLEQLKEMSFKMFFVGDGYARSQMQTFVEEQGLAGKVTFTGVIRDREQLKQYYAAADLFMFPSKYDNASLVLREAAVFHTPAIILKDSTIAAVVQHQHNGFLSVQELPTFVTDVKTIMANKLLLSQVGQNASATLTRSWEDVVNEVLDRYRHIQYRKAKNG